MARDFPELITVVHEDEGSMTGETRSKVFVKLYIAARESGLIRALGPDLWQTLCVLATRMNRDGLAWPSQSLLAADLGIGEKQAQRRMKRLQAFRFHGRPVVAAHSRIRSRDGRWLNNVYELFPVSGFGMFDNPREGESPAEATGHPRGVGADSSPHAGGLAPRTPRESSSTGAKRPASLGFPSFPGAEDRDIDRAPDLRQGAAASSSSPHPASPARRGTNKKTYLNKNTLWGGSTEPVRCSGMSLAETLVREFLERRHLPRREPRPKEIERARELIATVGGGNARVVLDYALAEAPKTGFRMQTFGAVLGYSEAALDNSERHERTRAKEEAREAQEAKRREYSAWRDGILEQRYQALSHEQIEALGAAVRSSLQARFAGQEYLISDSLVRCMIKDDLAGRDPLPTFDEWRSRHAA